MACCPFKLPRIWLLSPIIFLLWGPKFQESLALSFELLGPSHEIIADKNQLSIHKDRLTSDQTVVRSPDRSLIGKFESEASDSGWGCDEQPKQAKRSWHRLKAGDSTRGLPEALIFGGKLHGSLPHSLVSRRCPTGSSTPSEAIFNCCYPHVHLWPSYLLYITSSPTSREKNLKTISLMLYLLEIYLLTDTFSLWIN